MRRQFIISWESPKYDAFFTEQKVIQALNNRLRIDGHNITKVKVNVRSTFTGVDDIINLSDSTIVKLFKQNNYKDDDGTPLPSIVKKLCTEFGKTYTMFSARQRRILNQIFYTHELKIKLKEKDNDSSNENR